MNRKQRSVQRADWHTILTDEQLARADMRAQERLVQEERLKIRKRIKRKIPTLVKRVDKNIRKGKRPEAGVIVSPFLVDNDRMLIAAVVNEELANIGATSLRFTGLYYPTSNAYVPIPSGIFTRLYVGRNR